MHVIPVHSGENNFQQYVKKYLYPKGESNKGCSKEGAWGGKKRGWGPDPPLPSGLVVPRNLFGKAPSGGGVQSDSKKLFG